MSHSVIDGLVDISIRFGDIRDQSRKLSKLALNFGWSFAHPNFMACAFKSCTHIITPASRHVAWKSFVSILSLAPKL